MSSILIGGIVMSLLMMESWWNTCIKPFWFWIIYSIGFYYLTVRMAERSKALRSGRSPVFWARVRIPLLTLVHGAFHIIVLHSSTVNFFCDILKGNQADVAEWLRRLTRNQFPSGSVGSNPTICAAFCYSLNIELHFNITLSQIQITQRNASLDDFNDT